MPSQQILLTQSLLDNSRRLGDSAQVHPAVRTHIEKWQLETQTDCSILLGNSWELDLSPYFEKVDERR